MGFQWGAIERVWGGVGAHVRYLEVAVDDVEVVQVVEGGDYAAGEEHDRRVLKLCECECE